VQLETFPDWHWKEQRLASGIVCRLTELGRVDQLPVAEEQEEGETEYLDEEETC
jgi:hypothetical protein